MPLFRDLTVETFSGEQVPIMTSVRNYADLVGTLFVQVRNHLFPLMLKRADAGRMVEFGNFAVSGYAVRYKGKTISWNDVSRLLIVTGAGYHHLTIYRSGGLGLMPFCQFNLKLVPNDLLLVELLKRVAPPRLLVPHEARW